MSGSTGCASAAPPQVGPITFCAHRPAPSARLQSRSRPRGRPKPAAIPPAGETKRQVERLGARYIAACEPDLPEAAATTEDAPPVIVARRPETAADVLRAPTSAPISRRQGLQPTLPLSDPASEPELENARKMILEALSPVPVAVDELVRDCQVSLPVVLTILLELELAGRLERQAGQRVSLVP
jgi:predicted Rossmann fold nucleotide-binding protein DprA/Smf involved in DNA uptake